MSAHNFQDLTGQQFGRLTVIGYAGKNRHRNSMWNVRCDCGTEKPLAAGTIKGLVSCGCYRTERIRQEKTTHGLVHTRGYRVWQGMWSRCKYPSEDSYPLYGGRGITVCDRWKDPAAFIADMGQPEPWQTIERIDSDGNYEPDNCRWATKKEQARNRHTNHLLTAFGETLTIAEWSERKGYGKSVIENRLKRGWTPERAVSAPLDPRGRKRP